jgi:hypothetical protein
MTQLPVVAELTAGRAAARQNMADARRRGAGQNNLFHSPTPISVPGLGNDRSR